ncbi:MAG: hypothetical protein JSW03_00885 [Candidatus Eiseniibacteriota bacterium]|nr:MAG: hypothetical protein JSW03_00885 [Candidatus Eisenbacteria bacterium]
MKDSLRTGLTFGLTSGVITTLGLMVGLHSGTHSRLVVIGGIVTIAVADAFSDALGIHISEEAEHVHNTFEIWISTLATFASKFLFALTFVVPVIFLPLTTAIIVSLVWGFLILTLLSLHIARAQGNNPWKVVGEHLLIAGVVIISTHYIGHFVGRVCSGKDVVSMLGL